ncbi:MAG TPA: hypothetical protein V6C72_01555, partial [Chroococcales cyanobacterium]
MVEAQNGDNAGNFRQLIRDRISRRIQGHGQGPGQGSGLGPGLGQGQGTTTAGFVPPAGAQESAMHADPLHDDDDDDDSNSETPSTTMPPSTAMPPPPRVTGALVDDERTGSDGSTQKTKIAGLSVAVWKPTKPGVHAPYPTVIFSHGFHGSCTQSKFLMKALAAAGYLVISPNHKDAMGIHGSFQARPELPFRKVDQWSDSTFKYRHDDIVNLIQGLKESPQWKSQIDWSRLGLAGHSLGGYTVLGLAGAWPSWKIPGVKAILALSPYCAPFSYTHSLGTLNIPVMYQGGTRDFGITPTVKKPGGAYEQTGSPAYFVEFDKMGHFAWSDFNHSKPLQDLIDHYAVAFFNKYVLGEASTTLVEKLPGV